MVVTVREKQGVVVFSVKGEMVGGPDATKVSEKIRSFLDEGKKKFLIDMENVEWMNSSGLGILIASLTTVKNHQGQLKLLHVQKKPMELLKITKLDRVFEVFEDEGEAIASFVG